MGIMSPVIDLTWAPDMRLFANSFSSVREYYKGTFFSSGTIRIGFEFCEKLMLGSSCARVLTSIVEARDMGYRVHFILPVPHERHVSELAQWIAQLSKEPLIDAWVINSAGTIQLLEENDAQKRPIILGRLFDKSVHEIRYPLLSEPFQRAFIHSDASPGALGKYLLEHKTACGMEIDLIPGTELDVKRISEMTNCFVHVHTMFIGCTEFCLFGTEDGQSLIDARTRKACAQRCDAFARKIVAEKIQPVYQVGNALFSLHGFLKPEQIRGSFIPVIHPKSIEGMIKA